MRILSKEETLKWLSDNGLIPPEHTAFYGPQAISLSYKVPADSGKKTVLSNAILSFFDTDNESLVWITEYGIWPSSEDLVLFNGFRKSLGETRSLQDSPGHLFLRGDLRDIASLLGMVLYFVWGALIVSARGDVLVEISHDEMMDITLKADGDLVRRIKERIEPIVRPPP